MKGAGSLSGTGARTERNDFRSYGNPARAYGYPRSWVSSDPRNREPLDAIVERLDRIEALLVELVRERLP